MSHGKNINFSTFPILRTKRLVLRQIQMADAEDLLTFRGDSRVQKYNGPVYKNIAEAEGAIQKQLEEGDLKNEISWPLQQKKPIQ